MKFNVNVIHTLVYKCLWMSTANWLQLLVYCNGSSMVLNILIFLIHVQICIKICLCLFDALFLILAKRWWLCLCFYYYSNAVVLCCVIFLSIFELQNCMYFGCHLDYLHCAYILHSTLLKDSNTITIGNCYCFRNI